jgi:UrcA family protein
MRKFFTNLATAAALTLAAVPALGLLQAAHAAEPTARIAVGDLDLSNPTDAARFDHRVTAQGETLCRQINYGDHFSRLRQDECLGQVRLEVQRQLSSTQRHDLRQAAKVSSLQIATR